jgi:hypothetical protein
MVCAAAVAAILALDGLIHVLMAQTPFGAPRRAPAEPQVGGIVGWLLAKQSEFYREMSATIRAAKSTLGGLDLSRFPLPAASSRRRPGTVRR